MSFKTLNFCDKSKNNSIVCHSIPCKVKTDSEANVGQYFEPTIRQSDREDSVLLSSFRGRPLIGKQIDLPQNCSAFVVKTTKKDELVAENSFNRIIDWNLDKTPSESDSLPQLVQWIKISEAIHSSINSKCFPQNNQ